MRRVEVTFIFANVLEGKGKTGILALDNADFAKGAATDDSQKAEVVEID